MEKEVDFIKRSVELLDQKIGNQSKENKKIEDISEDGNMSKLEITENLFEEINSNLIKIREKIITQLELEALNRHSGNLMSVKKDIENYQYEINLCK